MKAEYSKKRRFLCLLFVTAWMMLGAAVTVSAAASGSWSVSKASYSFLTKSQKKIFNKAVKGLTGVTYEPVAVIAKQTLADTNYVFLAQGTTVTKNPVKNWYILTVCKNMKKKVSLLSAKKIKISSVKTNKNPRAGMIDGGWEIVAVKNKTAALPKKALSAYQKALKTFTGYSLRPIALLGTQVVAGTNYRILCYGKDRTNSDLFVVTIYKDLKGKCSISACKALKLESYIQITNPETTPMVSGGIDYYDWTRFIKVNLALQSGALSDIFIYSDSSAKKTLIRISVNDLYVLKTRKGRSPDGDILYWAYYRGVYGWIKANAIIF